MDATGSSRIVIGVLRAFAMMVLARDLATMAERWMSKVVGGADPLDLAKCW